MALALPQARSHSPHLCLCHSLIFVSMVAHTVRSRPPTWTCSSSWVRLDQPGLDEIAISVRGFAYLGANGGYALSRTPRNPARGDDRNRTGGSIQQVRRAKYRPSAALADAQTTLWRLSTGERYGEQSIRQIAARPWQVCACQATDEPSRSGRHRLVLVSRAAVPTLRPSFRHRLADRDGCGSGVSAVALQGASIGSRRHNARCRNAGSGTGLAQRVGTRMTFEHWVVNAPWA